MKIVQFSEVSSEIIIELLEGRDFSGAEGERVAKCTVSFSVSDEFKERLKPHSIHDDDAFMGFVTNAVVNHVMEDPHISDCFSFAGNGSEVNSFAAIEAMETFQEKLREAYPDIVITKLSLAIHYRSDQVYTYVASRDAEGNPVKNPPIVDKEE